MRIEYAILCRYAEVNNNLATIVGAGIDTTAVPQLPTPIQTMLAIRAVCPPDEMPGTHHLRCYVEGPDGARIGDSLDAEIEVAGEAPAQEWLANMMFAFGVQWEVATEGTYTIHASVDDADYPVPMHVVLGGSSPDA